jgi:hypothetical protein
MSAKGIRCKNFTEFEKKMLLEITEKDPIIENKQTDGVTAAKKKNLTWQEIDQFTQGAEAPNNCFPSMII